MTVKTAKKELADRLAEENLEPALIGTEVADKLFRTAWEDGHANGEYEVRYYYEERADAVNAAFRFGLEYESEPEEGDFYTDLGGEGVWRYDGSKWKKLEVDFATYRLAVSTEPSGKIVTGDEVAVSGTGIRRKCIECPECGGRGTWTNLLDEEELCVNCVNGSKFIEVN